jgi:cytosine/creatinine deaminase
MAKRKIKILTSEAARRRRTLISQVLVAGLIAVAYSEPVSPVSEAFDNRGVGIDTLAWIFVYAATVLRFFVGDILHLEKEDLVAPEAEVRWFWDVSFIVLQCIVLIFAGAVTTIYASASSKVTFVEYLLILYALDVFWIASVHVTHRVGSSDRFGGLLRRMVRDGEMPPVGWAVMNIGLGLMMWRLGLVTNHSLPSEWKLYTVVGANGAAFAADVFFIKYGLREREGKYRTGDESSLQGGAGLTVAIDQAKISLQQGGIPIGAALMDGGGGVIGKGHNRRLQNETPILHAEMDCIAQVGLRGGYAGLTLYSTLMPCYMCAGAIVQFGIRRVIMGESRNFHGAGKFMREHGIEVLDLDNIECRRMLSDFISEHPDAWREDIGMSG